MVQTVKWIMFLLAFVLPIVTGWADGYLRDNYVRDEYSRTLMVRAGFIVNIGWLVLLYIVWLVAGLKESTNKYRFLLVYHLAVPVFAIVWVLFVFIMALFFGGWNDN